MLFVGAEAKLTRLGTTAFAPPGFDVGRIFEEPRAIAEQHSVQMVERLASSGWPRWIATAGRLGSKRASASCAHCHLAHASTWVRDGVCLGCEHKLRREGRCPFAGTGAAVRVRCGPHAWCPHDRRCFLCDGWSCAQCRFHQGDGSDVSGLVETLRPACLFLDFDRTLCSTRGGSPLRGQQSIDEELLGLCAQMAGRVHVVTRNAHVDDIRTFLASLGLPSLPVHRVPRPRSKADVICDPQWIDSSTMSAAEGLAEGFVTSSMVGANLRGSAAAESAAAESAAAEAAAAEAAAAEAAAAESAANESAANESAANESAVEPVVLFVDDTLAEHVDPEIRKSRHIVRFLFTRAK